MRCPEPWAAQRGAELGVSRWRVRGGRCWFYTDPQRESGHADVEGQGDREAPLLGGESSGKLLTARRASCRHAKSPPRWWCCAGSSQ